jgi:hypothetical protein
MGTGGKKTIYSSLQIRVRNKKLFSSLSADEVSKHHIRDCITSQQAAELALREIKGGP